MSCDYLLARNYTSRHSSSWVKIVHDAVRQSLGGKTKHVVSTPIGLERPPAGSYDIPQSPLSTRLEAALLHPLSPLERSRVTLAKARGTCSTVHLESCNHSRMKTKKALARPELLGLIIQEYLLIEAYGRGAQDHVYILTAFGMVWVRAEFPCTWTRTCVSVPNVNA